MPASASVGLLETRAPLMGIVVSGPKPALDDHGYRYSKKLSAGDNPKIIAGRLTRELRSALRGRDAPTQGFDEPIKYFDRGKI